MACIQVLPEVGGYTSVHKDGLPKSPSWQREVTSRYGVEITGALQRYARGTRSSTTGPVQARCDPTGVDRWGACGGHRREVQRHALRRQRGTGRRDRLRQQDEALPARCPRVADVLLLGEGPDEGAIDALVQRLEAGLPEGALGLMDLPVGLTRGEYLALHNAGYSTTETVLALPAEELGRYVGWQRAERLRRSTPAN